MKENEEYLNEGNTVSFGQDTATMFYQERPYFTGDKIKVLQCKYTQFSKQNAIFIVPALEKAFSSFSWGASSFNVKIIEETKITLPTKDGAIDFAFMEDFISEIEKQPLTALENYLTVTGLKNYNLTKEEEDTLNSLDKVQWKDFTIGDLFEIATGRDVIIRDVQQGNIPLISHQHENNGITKYIKPLKDRTLFNHQTTISLADRGVFYATNQNEDFHIGTRVKALSFKQGKISKKVRLFLVSAINKLQVLFTEYSQNATDKLPFLKITLPTKNGTPDYDFMNTYIKAIEKLVIKEVVLYAEKKIQATQEAIK